MTTHRIIDRENTVPLELPTIAYSAKYKIHLLLAITFLTLYILTINHLQVPRLRIALQWDQGITLLLSLHQALLKMDLKKLHQILLQRMDLKIQPHQAILQEL